MSEIETQTEPPYKTKANKRRILNILNYIKEHPNEWNQTLWVDDQPCRTRFCFAGFAIQRSKKYKFIRLSTGDFSSDVMRVGEKDRPGNELGKDWWRPAQIGQEILGLNEQEADNLFSGGNKLDDLETVIDDILDSKYPPYSWEDDDSV
jgi:hypothetical protein